MAITANLDERVAEEFFGWRWMAFTGTPVRGADGYPNKTTVRQFFPPDSDLSEDWRKYLEKHGASPASGNEPLSYRYCSSCGPHVVPHFSGDENALKHVERELDNRNSWDKYQEMLVDQLEAFDSQGKVDGKKLRAATCEQKCIAALAAVGIAVT